MTEQSAKNCSGATSIVRLTTIWQPSVMISFFLLFSLSFESIPLPIQAQIIPLTSLLAVFFLPFTMDRIRMTPLFKMVALFSVFVLLHSVVALFIDVVASGAGEVRVFAWFRQVVALVMGLSVFFVLRRTLTSVSDRFIIYVIIAGALPALTLALLNVLWGLAGSAWAGVIVRDIRSTLIPLGYTSPSRASGLSLEPSHFAFYLVTIVIPICFVKLMMSRRLFQCIILFGLVLTALVWTLSTTGFVTLFCFSLLGLLLGPERRLFGISTSIVLLVVLGAFILVPNNYLVYAVKKLVSGQWGLSIINHVYGSIGPLLKGGSSYVLLGYGLGGIATHFKEIVPEVAWQSIQAVSWEGLPSLGSLFARILAESGLIGLLLFASVIIVSFRESKCKASRSINSPNRSLIRIGRLALIALLIGQTIGKGSFALPYLWLWLAIIDSRYIIYKRNQVMEGSHG